MDGDTMLAVSKYIWLRNPEKMTKSQKARFNELRACEFKPGVSWALMNVFRDF
jgi:transposase